MTLKNVGTLYVPGRIDITDPYQKKNLKSWASFSKPMEEGNYDCFISRVDGRISSIRIVKEDVLFVVDWKLQCRLVTESKLLGFFVDKKDFSTDEWISFVEVFKQSDKDYCLDDNDFFANSGRGCKSYKLMLLYDESLWLFDSG